MRQKSDRKKKKKLRSGDFLLTIFTAMLVIFGIIMVFSASYYYSISQDGNAYSYLLRHGMWAVLGFGAMIVGAAVDYRIYRKFAIPLLILGGESIREFVLPLMVGIIAGAYSSIAVCSPLYYDFNGRRKLSKYEKQVKANIKNKIGRAHV